MKGLYDTYPILKVTCCKLGQGKKSLLSLDFDDLLSVFEKFGKLYEILVTNEQKVCYIFYQSFFNAFVAMKLLNNINLRSVPSELCVEWCPTQDYDQINSFFNNYHETVEWNRYPSSDKENENENGATNPPSGSQTTKQNKLTCRYDIQI